MNLLQYLLNLATLCHVWIGSLPCDMPQFLSTVPLICQRISCQNLATLVTKNLLTTNLWLALLVEKFFGKTCQQTKRPLNHMMKLFYIHKLPKQYVAGGTGTRSPSITIHDFDFVNNSSKLHRFQVVAGTKASTKSRHDRNDVKSYKKQLTTWRTQLMRSIAWNLPLFH